MSHEHIFPKALAWIGVLVILTTGGCASTENPEQRYNPATGRTQFQSPKVLVGNVNMTSGLAGGQRLMMQAFASCEGPACRPSTVELAFFNDSSADLNLDYRRIELVVDGRSMDWEDLGRFDESPHYFVPRGEFIRVPLSRGDFERFAGAAEVRVIFGLTGTSTFRMPYERREPLREMAANLQATGGA